METGRRKSPMTIMVLRSHVREGIAPDTEIRPEIVNSAEISLPEVTEEMFDANWDFKVAIDIPRH